MTDPGFKVEGIHHAAPFRERAAFSGYQAFGDGNWTILVEPETARSIRAAAGKALPQETGGLLSGRTLRDAAGQYVLVSGFVQAEPSAGRSFAFSISPQATARLREESARAHPTADVVGWWHSHSAPGSYSQVDRNTQTIFKQPDSVGLLVFARGEPWAKAYMGPESRELDLMAAVRARQDENSHTPEDGRSSQGHRVLNIPDPPKPGWPATPRAQGPARLAVTAGSVLLLILILIIITLFAVQNLSSRVGSVQQQLSGQLTSGQQQLSGQLRSGQQQLSRQMTRDLGTPPPAPSISTSCAAAMTAGGYYTGDFTCTATPTAPGTIEWKADGKPIGSGPTLSIPMPLHRSGQVQAVLVTSAGTYPGTVQTIRS